MDGIKNVLLWCAQHFVFINLIFSFIIIFFQRRNPATVWAWLLVLYFIPIAGFLLYLMLGQDFRKSRMFRAKEIEGEIKYAIRRQEESIHKKQLRLKDPAMERYRDLILYNLSSAKAVITDDNDICIYTDGQEKFEALLEEMEKAVNYIHLQYYIIRNDELWEKIEEVLVRKVRSGVEVRVLFDSCGCRNMTRKVWTGLKQEGIRVAEFFPAVLGKLQLRLNYRNHRKIVVIDGRIGFLGGFNIGCEYLGQGKKFGYWRDTHIRIEGSAVTSLAVRFVLDWNYAAGENLFSCDRLFTVPVYARKGCAPVQIVSSGPDSSNPVIRDNYLRLIGKARHHIYIQTPYFIPDEAILAALKIAARSGVKVRIMVPCRPDHPLVYWVTYSYLGEMIAEGAEGYIYENGFLHAKTLTVDGEVTCMGTANMDIRSFQLNFEVNAAIYHEPVTRRMEEAFLEDIRKCTLLDSRKYGERPFTVRIKEQVSRLFSPLL